MAKSTQIKWFSRQLGEGGWSGRDVAQRRPRVSKLGLKGLASYNSSEMTVREARWGGTVGRTKGLLSQNIYSKERAGQQLSA